MRTSTLQYLYLQKPISSLVIICLISVLPWIGGGHFTEREAKEVAVASSILERGEWILPQAEIGKPSYHPPMTYWLMALFSLPEGKVNTFTGRLFSVLAFTILIAAVLVFFGKRIRFQEAYIATFLLLTCFQMHRSGMTAGTDMLLTMFIFLSLIQLYRWENKLELKGLPVLIPLLISGGILTNGAVGMVLPLFIFGVYLLMLRKYRLRKILKSIFYAGISSLFLPLLWYISAWKAGGEAFLNAVWFENISRFSIFPLPLEYNIPSHGIWFNFATLFLGFFPWTLLAFFSIFGLRIAKLDKTLFEYIKEVWTRILALDKIKLFSLVALVCIFFFYSIPAGKLSAYLLPAYPFLGLFLSQLFLYITEHRSKVTRIFAALLAVCVTLIVIAIVLVMTGAVDLGSLAGILSLSENQVTLLHTISQPFIAPSALTIILLILLIASLATVYYQMLKRINIKMLYATILLTFCLNMLVNSIALKTGII